MQASPDKIEYACVLALSSLVPGVPISALGGRIPAALPGAVWRWKPGCWRDYGSAHRYTLSPVDLNLVSQRYTFFPPNESCIL